MRTFAPLGDDLAVPERLLEEIVRVFGQDGGWVLIGATARDIALRAGGARPSLRATRDVDLAVAVESAADFTRLTRRLDRSPGAPWQRHQLLGAQVDVVPCGPLEFDGVVQVAGSEINVLGCAEAAHHADRLTLGSGATLPFAALEHIAILKIIAFRDRAPGTVKDAEDLRDVLRASSDGVYGADVWDDEEAMGACDHDHQLAGAYRLGRVGIQAFGAARAATVLNAVDAVFERLLGTWPHRS